MNRQDLHEIEQRSRHADEPGRDPERQHEKDAVQNTLDRSRGEGQRKRDLAPYREQVAADDFSRPQRKDAAGEQTDENGMGRFPEAQTFDGAKQREPSPCLHHIDGKVEHDGHQHPSPLDGENGRLDL